MHTLLRAGSLDDREQDKMRYNRWAQLSFDQWAQRPFPGPQEFPHELSSWKVLRTAMMAVRASAPCALDAYEARIRPLAREYPKLPGRSCSRRRSHARKTMWQQARNQTGQSFERGIFRGKIHAERVWECVIWEAVGDRSTHRGERQ